jgi:predicted RNA binding protein YcfA (HicA-like mRNA interferase family)/predicted RNase H-like HicB family nuclease
VKVSELISLLEADGWYQVRIKGSHRQFYHPKKKGTMTVAGKPSVDIPRSTLSSTLKQVGLKKLGVTSMQYLVVVEKGPTSYGAYVPDLPGCVAAGNTKEEVLVLIREAIDLHLDDLRSEGQPIPVPSSTSELVEVEAA